MVTLLDLGGVATVPEGDIDLSDTINSFTSSTSTMACSSR